MISSDGSGGQNTRGGSISDGGTIPSCRVPDGDHGDVGHVAVWGRKEANY